MFTEVDTLLEIAFEPFESAGDTPTFALIFSKTFDDGSAHKIVTFNKWDGREAEFSSQAYILNEPYNKEALDPFDEFSLF